MKKISTEKLDKLDDMNLSWLLQQISVGNVVRGYYRFIELITPVGKNIQSCLECENSRPKEKEKEKAVQE